MQERKKFEFVETVSFEIDDVLHLFKISEIKKICDDQEFPKIKNCGV